MPKAGISKWQKKSVAINQIRWDLEKILSDDLTQEEKQSERYRQLVESAYTAVDHSVPNDLSREAPKSSKWLTVLWYSLATSGGAILLKSLEMLSSFLLGSSTP